jgi:shikimate kinase
MIIALTGVACVGKSSIGKKLAEDVGFRFFDLDVEIERFYGTSIPRLRAEILTDYSWRLKAAPVLKKILEENRQQDAVVALSPSGLMDAYLRVIKKSNAVVVVLQDTPENILKRITFYDDDSQPIAKLLSEKEKKYYLNDIKQDITYYGRSYRRALFRLDIAGMDITQAASALKDLLGLPLLPESSVTPKSKRPPAHQAISAITYTNRKGHTYYLHVGVTKKGNPRYYFSTKDTGDTCAEIPGGYEIHENPNAQVFLRKIQPKLIGDEEVQIVEQALKQHPRPSNYRLDVRGEIITVYESNRRGLSVNGFAPFSSAALMQEIYDKQAHFMPVLRFVLLNEDKRLFGAERYCFRGSIEDWMPLLGAGRASLKDLARKYVKHLGEESFFELM